MLRVLLLLLFSLAVFVSGGAFLASQFNTPPWLVVLLLVGLGVGFYGANAVLMHYYIRLRTPDFLSRQKVFGGFEAWELTAGLGIVPKWVSVIGLCAWT